MCVAVLFLPHLTSQFEVNARQLVKWVKHLASILYHFWRRWSTWISSERATVTQRRSLWVTLLCPREMLLSSMTMLYHVGSGKLDEDLSSRDELPWAALVRVASTEHHFEKAITTSLSTGVSQRRNARNRLWRCMCLHSRCFYLSPSWRVW